MNLLLVGCSHHQSSVAVRERLAFSAEQSRLFLDQFYLRFPRSEAVLLATCNRTELYAASNDSTSHPSEREMIQLLAESRDCRVDEVLSGLFSFQDSNAVRHLFSVAASLNSMVVGEGQILSQVKQAYQLAIEANSSIPVTHRVFQAAIRVARRVANETEIHAKRVSIPSVAIGLFACQIFERLDNKKCLVIGAGEMAEETLNYLLAHGGKEIVIVNRTPARAEALANRFSGRIADWSQLSTELAQADIVVSATGSDEPIFDLESFRPVHRAREQRPLFILDLALPRDFTPDVGDQLNVYLFTIDDLQKECERNLDSRLSEWPKAEKIIDQETVRFMREMMLRSGGATIAQLKEQANLVKTAELTRLTNRLDNLDPSQQKEIEYAFHRLVNKILHPPLDALKTESRRGSTGLLDALRRLFQLGE